MKLFIFKVSDRDGLWGNLRVQAETEELAKENCLDFLKDKLFDPTTAVFELIGTVII